MEPQEKTTDEQAAGWAVRVETGPLQDADRLELDRWLDADSRHRGAFVRARAAWRSLDRFAALAGGRIHAQPPPEEMSLREQPVNRRRFLAAGAAVLTVACAGLWVALQMQGETYVSVIGEQRRVSLPDDSSMVLNTATEIVVDLDEARRAVQLVRGEALFEVAKDPARPFVVRVDDVTVTALGTAFAVRAYAHRVDVTVTEGVVEVARRDSSSRITPVRVVANQRAIVNEAGPVEIRTIERQEVERRLAWRGGMVAFDGESLSEAVAEINRHNVRRIVIADAELASRPVVGIFHASDVETFSRAAAAVLGARIVHDGDAIRLEARSSD